MTLLLGIGAAAIVLVGLVALFYYYFDAPSIDEEEEHDIEEETPAERAEILAERREKIEEAKIDDLKKMYAEE